MKRICWETARARARFPLGQPSGNLDAIRDALHECMWEDVGILRDAKGLARAGEALSDLERKLLATGVAGGDLRYNLTWHDWMNLESLINVSRAIREAAEARTDSRGAHYREDFPETGALEGSSFSRVRLSPAPLGEGAEEGAQEGPQDGREEAARFSVDFVPVRFTRVRPGESLLAA